MVFRVRATAWLVLVLGAHAVAAQISPRFDFQGFVPAVPSEQGEAIELLAILYDGGTRPAPIHVDFARAQHTVVLRAKLDATSGFTQSYGTATLAIYADVGPQTPADYTQPSTFADGELVLTGVFVGALRRDQGAAARGSFLGNVTWTAGSRRGELGRNTSHWSFGGAINATPYRVPFGFSERWEGLIGQMVVAVESPTWGAVKALYLR